MREMTLQTRDSQKKRWYYNVKYDGNYIESST